MTFRRTARLLVVLLAAIALVAASCGDDDDTATAPGDDTAEGADDTAEGAAGTDASTSDEGATEPGRSAEGGENTAEGGDDTAEGGDDTAEGDGATRPLVEVAGTELGPILTSGDFTLYAFTPDPPGETTCFAECAAVWPPLEAPAGELVVGDDLDAARFGAIDRGDGTMQVTYDDIPLYFYGPDGPGDTSGQGVQGIWFVVDPSGAIVQTTGGDGFGY